MQEIALTFFCMYLFPPHPRFTFWLICLKNSSIMPFGVFLVYGHARLSEAVLTNMFKRMFLEVFDTILCISSD